MCSVCRSRRTAADSARSRVAWCGRSARAPRLTLSSSVNTRVFNPGAGRGRRYIDTYTRPRPAFFDAPVEPSNLDPGLCPLPSTSDQLPCASSCYCYTVGVHTTGRESNNSIDGPSMPASAARRRASPQGPARDGWRVGSTTATQRPCRLTRDGQVSGCTVHEPQHARRAARAARLSTAFGAARRGLSAARASLSTSSHGAGPPRQQFDFKFVCMRDT